MNHSCLRGMGGPQAEMFLRVLLMLGFVSFWQICPSDATIDLLVNGITTVGKTFRVVCTMKDGESFVGWFDVKGNEVTARPIPDELIQGNYVEESGNAYTLVIQNVAVDDGGNYTCKGDRSESKFTLFIEFFVTQFPDDQNLRVGKTETVLCSAEGYPKPTFVWYKNFKRVKTEVDPRFTLLPNGSLVIDPVHESDTGDYICRITQLGDEVGTSLREQRKDITVMVYAPPRINTEKSTNQTELYSYVGNPTAVTIKCVWWGYPNPTLSIRKNDIDLPSGDVEVKEWTKEDLLSYLTATVITDSDEDFGEYTCHASNSLGSANYTVDIYKQGPPRINVEESTKQTELYSYVDNPTAVTIKCVWWGDPKPILSIRKNDTALPSGDVEVKEPTGENMLSYLTATVITDGDEDFGTYTCHASNYIGSANYSVDINKPVPPTTPRNITFNLTCDHLTVAWTPPEFDGGLPLARYSVEINDTSQWSYSVFVNVTKNRFTFTSKDGLKPGTLYTVYVQAFNDFKKGEKGQGSVISAYCPPRINVEESTKKTELYSYVGNPTAVTIKCVWWGYPNLTLSIRKNDIDLPSEDFEVQEPTGKNLLGNLTATVITDGDEDFGAYTCHASNPLGSETYVVDINEQGPPTAPRNITFTLTCDHLTVAWAPPEFDGGLPLIRYALEINDTSQWSDSVFVGMTTNRFTFTSKDGLKPRTLYTVYVQAFNEIEKGPEGQGSVISAYCPPSGPYTITNNVTRLNSTTFTLKWTRPPNDGGDPDLRYIVEYSKETADGKYVHWNSRKNILTQEYNVTGLESGSKYEFRVFVSNVAGRKREPAVKEFNVYSGVDVTPTPTDPGPSGQPLLVYDMSVNCTSFYMQVEFILKSSYLDTETFRFDNKSCGSHTVTSEHVSLRTPLDACGTTKKDGEDSVTYFNKIVAETADKETIYIVEFPFSCTYGVRETIGSPSFQPRKKITYLKEGHGNFSFEMGLYRSSEYKTPYDVSEYPVNVDPFGHLYCEAKLDTSDSGLVLLADTCVATPSMNPADSMQYIFIDDGCPVDNGTKYDHTLTPTQRFRLDPFRWVPENYTLVYLHCNVIVCQKSGSTRCSMGCQPDSRRARSIGKDEIHRVTLGPIRLRKPQQSKPEREPLSQPDQPSSSSMPTWMLILCICGAIIGLGLMLYGAVHLFLYLTSDPQNVAVPPVQKNSEEMELFCPENV